MLSVVVSAASEGDLCDCYFSQWWGAAWRNSGPVNFVHLYPGLAAVYLGFIQTALVPEAEGPCCGSETRRYEKATQSISDPETSLRLQRDCVDTLFTNKLHR